ncbi:MAG TPA: flavodoxin family protein, partial [Desulfobacteria bacterium]|nr:flavodoxin family protein [Desulfobacteria bacterium]
MRFIAFIGSPRADGTTRFIVDKLLAGAQAAGAETKSYLLTELEFRGCQGCRKCKQEGVCDQKDDLSPLYAEIMASDVLVVSSPVYMAYLTGQTKLFLDRLYAFTGPDQVSRVPHGKKCVLVLTQGYHDTTAYQALIKNVSSLLT